MSEDVSHINPSLASVSKEENLAKQAEVAQTASHESFSSWSEQAFNPWAADKERMETFKRLSERQTDMKAMIKEEQQVVGSLKFEKTAKEFQQRNPELSSKLLLQLRSSLKDGDTPEEILKKAQELFPDPYLTDDALEFLKQSTDGTLGESVQHAKDTLNQESGRQIAAGRNIAEHTREFSEQGLGSPTALRDLYKDITGNPREPPVLFDELSKAYPFEKLKTVVQFLLHSLGGDLRSKGPSIQPGELARLFTEARTLQAIYGVYKFFLSRMHLVETQFATKDLHLPPQLTFEQMAKLFMKLLDDRYPNGTKIIKMAGTLGLEQEILALLIVIAQWRDAVRNVSPRLYKNMKQRDDLFGAIIESLDTLEDEEEEIEQKDEDKDKEKQKDKEK